MKRKSAVIIMTGVAIYISSNIYNKNGGNVECNREKLTINIIISPTINEWHLKIIIPPSNEPDSKHCVENTALLGLTQPSFNSFNANGNNSGIRISKNDGLDALYKKKKYSFYRYISSSNLVAKEIQASSRPGESRQPSLKLRSRKTRPTESALRDSTEQLSYSTC
jgi:hypothetical protein